MRRKKQYIKLYHYYTYSENEIAGEYNKFMNSICLDCKCYTVKYKRYISLYQNNIVNKYLRVGRIKYKLSKYVRSVKK